MPHAGSTARWADTACRKYEGIWDAGTDLAVRCNRVRGGHKRHVEMHNIGEGTRMSNPDGRAGIARICNGLVVAVAVATAPSPLLLR